MSITSSKIFEKEGVVEKIIYKNDENGYVVFNMNTKEREIVTIVGYMSGVRTGENFKVKGVFKKHSNFGNQLCVETFEVIPPTTSESILKYLTSGALKGIGPSRAKKIVEKFGEESLKIIENEPFKLNSIKGITNKTAKKISKDYKENFNLRKTIVELSKFNIMASEAVRAYSEFGENVLNLIKKNPYILCKSPVSIDFNKADSIFSFNKNDDQNMRIRAFLEYVLNQNSINKGHTCLQKDKLIDIASNFISVSEEILNKVLKDLLREGTFKKIVQDNEEFIYIKEIFECEEYVSKKINTMLKFPVKNVSKIDELILNIEEKDKINYAFLQKEAIKLAVNEGMLILTGGPGTGKTTVLRAIIKILKQKGEKILLTAPTGRAAQRMYELTGIKTRTIHRLLEATHSENKKQVFRKNQNNLLKCDTIIVDELSMVDIFVFEALLRALPMGARLIMIGDENQLPPVGCGNVLIDLIRSCRICTIHLKKIFRQSLESLIVKNAHKIISGENPILDIKNNDFFFLKCKNYEIIKRIIVDVCVNRLPKSYKFSPTKDIQIICPGKKGSLGTFELNRELQDAINPTNGKKVEMKTSDFLLREGDKVMQIKNNYDLMASKSDGTLEEGVFNGDVGIIKKIDNFSKTLVVNFYDKTVKYEFSQANELTLSYAITVHKSQGNEFPVVVMPMFEGPNQLYFRKLLYTGVTRAKKLLILVGKEEILYKMIKNNKKFSRNSGLFHMLTRKEV